jgi:hypothetical protein
MKQPGRLISAGLIAVMSVVVTPITPADAMRPTCATPELVTLAFYAGWPPKEIPKVMRTMYKESRCQTWARNRWATGLMQVHKLHLPRLCASSLRICNRLDLMDPFRNLQAAHDVWVRSGWSAWAGGGA